jgi:sulfur-oxidizing protein SoxA
MRWASAAAAVMSVAMTATAAEPERPTPPLSGLAFQSPETQAMQADDTANPGLLWVAQGQALWRARSGTERSCADCHGDAAAALKGVAARYPAYDPPSRSLFNLERRINQCRSVRQSLPPLAYESDELLALTAYVAHQSRGQPVAVAIDGPARPFFEAGRKLYEERSGQLNLACRHCHDQNVGRMLRGDRISQGQSNGYPAYRLEWQSVGSLQRRLRFCHTGLRAEPFAYGADEYLALELYLAWRAQGLAIETPAVRR